MVFLILYNENGLSECNHCKIKQKKFSYKEGEYVCYVDSWVGVHIVKVWSCNTILLFNYFARGFWDVYQTKHQIIHGDYIYKKGVQYLIWAEYVSLKLQVTSSRVLYYALNWSNRSCNVRTELLWNTRPLVSTQCYTCVPYINTTNNSSCLRFKGISSQKNTILNATCSGSFRLDHISRCCYVI